MTYKKIPINYQTNPKLAEHRRMFVSYVRAGNGLVRHYKRKFEYLSQEQKQNMLDKALGRYQIAQVHAERLMPKNKLFLARCNLKIAEVYKLKGMMQTANELYRFAIELSGEQLGEEHSYVTSVRGALAISYCEQGDYAKCEEMLVVVLRELRKQFGRSRRLVEAIRALARCYQALQQHQKADALLKAADQIEASLGNDTSNSIWKRFLRGDWFS